ncbi:TetR/AcrR family transcriptional regulator [Pseudokineococcus basanitobsidens]|uniref:TetR/AcrR family transcriptional regulator n=1 Tax=Pseudokineococcus basanitobsidens TaxID=1926649 RepID=A0ABU8RM28_9ACTN
MAPVVGGPGTAPDSAGATGAGRGARPDRREQILVAADQVVAEEGFSAVSVRTVAARAGIGASTLRYWFPSQDDLVTALARRRVDPFLDDRRIADAAVPPVERLAECLAQLLPAAEADRPVLEDWAALLSTAVGPHATPLGRALYAGGQQSVAARVRAWLDVLVAEGALPAGRVPTAVPALLTRADGLALGLLPGGAVPDLATALAVLRADVEALLRRPDVATADP